MALAAAHSKAVVQLLLIDLMLIGAPIVGLFNCFMFVVSYFISILVLQSS